MRDDDIGEDGAVNEDAAYEANQASIIDCGLNVIQADALSKLEGGRNLFITGFAGTGKSYLLTSWLDEREDVAVTASTGIAAWAVNGQTLHSWLGVSPHDDTVKRVVAKQGWSFAAERIKRARALVIDEISMVDGKLFTLAEALCRHARSSVEPWGGLQIVVVGDFDQLPPVEADEKGWSYETDAWRDAAFEEVELTEPMRSADVKLHGVLRDLRLGFMTAPSCEALHARLRAYDPDERGATRLMTHNAQADQVNDWKLSQIPSEGQVYVAREEGHPKWLDSLDRDCLSPRELWLKVGARVMFTRNDHGRLWVNGSTGEVTELLTGYAVRVKLDSNGSEVVVTPAAWEKRDGNRVLAKREQIPLRLAWAITVHKSQGMSIDNVSVDLSRVFAQGQAYVALSRARSLAGLNIEAWKGPHALAIRGRRRKALDLGF